MRTALLPDVVLRLGAGTACGRFWVISWWILFLAKFSKTGLFFTFGWATWPLQCSEGHFHSLFCTLTHRKLPRALEKLDQYSIIIVTHCQQFQQSNLPNQRKSRNRNSVRLAETEDYLSSHAQATHYFYKFFMLLLFHKLSPWLESGLSI
jgi:hypothetical protein